MPDISKMQSRAEVDRRPEEGPVRGAEAAAIDAELRALVQRIRHDASDDPAAYLLRSNTGHDGE